ncbi:hypothetical protein Sjap_006353 [Stephania japonica]|uniref:Uncharacterized protein n=1 Tax=Stephania japonica TaxID=461633 RepID=A0AAP0K6V8_9MAGN
MFPALWGKGILCSDISFTLPPQGAISSSGLSSFKNLFQIPSNPAFDIGFVTKSDFALNVVLGKELLLSKEFMGVSLGNPAKLIVDFIQLISLQSFFFIPNSGNLSSINCNSFSLVPK